VSHRVRAGSCRRSRSRTARRRRSRIAHHIDSLELVQELIAAGLGVGLLPADQKPARGVSLMPVRDPDVTLRSYVVIRRGRENWPPLALIARELAAGARR
jgi:DNA-binding transcriptional LysR family regulator